MRDMAYFVKVVGRTPIEKMKKENYEIKTLFFHRHCRYCYQHCIEILIRSNIYYSEYTLHPLDFIMKSSLKYKKLKVVVMAS